MDNYSRRMKTRILFGWICLLNIFSMRAQDIFNAGSKKQLDSLLAQDQKYRPVFMLLLDPSKTDSLVAHHQMPVEKIEELYASLQEKIDSSNLRFVEEFIAHYGYPGKSMVGEPTNEVAWYVIQHSDKIEKYFKIIKQAGERKELPLRLVAMMQDRLLVEQNKKQLYGTQIARRKLGDSKEESVFVWPVKRPCFVNKRRRKAGSDTTTEQNARRFHIQY